MADVAEIASEERRLILEWLRQRMVWVPSGELGDFGSGEAYAISATLELLEAIERGEHRQPTPEPDSLIPKPVGLRRILIDRPSESA